MPSYDALANKKRELIRKALTGSVFVAPLASDPVAELTEKTGVAPNEVIDLVALPTGYDDVGWLSTEGAAFAREVAQSEVASWGSNTPTRTDITADSTSLTFLMQETKLLSIGLATGADLSAIVPDVDTGEVSIEKPETPDAKSYRTLSVAVDKSNAGDIYVARFLPAAKVTNYTEQAFGAGDDPIGWGVTVTGEKDSTLGYTERWIFGGAGWFALLADMGFDVTP